MTAPSKFTPYDPPKPVWYFKAHGSAAIKMPAWLLGENASRARVRVTYRGVTTEHWVVKENIERRME